MVYTAIFLFFNFKLKQPNLSYRAGIRHTGQGTRTRQIQRFRIRGTPTQKNVTSTCGTPPRKSKRANPLIGAPQPEQQPQKIRNQKTVIQKQQKPQTRTAATANRTHGCKQYSVLQIHITK